MAESCKGKPLPVETIETVVKLKKHFDSELKSGKEVSTKDPAGRTAAALGIGVATVKRIMSKHCKGELILDRAARQGRPTEFCQDLQFIVRKHIREKNLKGEMISLSHLKNFLQDVHKEKVPKTTLWRALNRWGFTYGEGQRRDSLKEKDYVINARRAYLRRKRSNRNSDGTLLRAEVYLDETYVNKNHSNRLTWYWDEDGSWVNKPSGVGPRLIIVNAVTKNGWVKNTELVFEAKKRTGDYHGQMNWDNFSRWFTDQLLPNIPANSLIILDNAKYHNVQTENGCPGSQNTKEQLCSWLSRNGYPWGGDMLKSELLHLCKKITSEPEYKLDLIAEEAGHEILRTPPYHPELQPIEMCWAVVKNHVADVCDFTMKGLRSSLIEGFSKVTPKTCQAIIEDVLKQENKYWKDDKKLDDEPDAESSHEGSIAL